MSVGDLDVVRRVTENYFFWQGLRWVPFGILFLIFGAAMMTDGDNDVLLDVLLLVAVTAALLVNTWLDRYYARTFGRVTDRARAHRRRTVLKWALVYPALVAAVAIDLTVAPPLLVSGPMWAGAMVAYWVSTGRGRPHVLVAAAATLFTVLIPLTGASPDHNFGIFFVVVGMVYVVVGLLDHRELVGVLGHGS